MTIRDFYKQSRFNRIYVVQPTEEVTSICPPDSDDNLADYAKAVERGEEYYVDYDDSESRDGERDQYYEVEYRIGLDNNGYAKTDIKDFQTMQNAIDFIKSL